MKTVGQLLKSARQKQHFTLRDIATKTRIRLDYLKALESDAYDQLPSYTYTRGFIKNYAECLDLPAHTLLAVLRRDFTQTESGAIIPRSILDNPVPGNHLWTPKVTMATAIGFLCALFLGFLAYQYTSFLKPKLDLTSPKQNEILLGPTIRIAGSTDPSVVLSVNESLVVVKPDGRFETSLNLNPGQTTLRLTATNSRQKSTTLERQITVRQQATNNP